MNCFQIAHEFLKIQEIKTENKKPIKALNVMIMKKTAFRSKTKLILKKEKIDVPSLINEILNYLFKNELSNQEKLIEMCYFCFKLTKKVSKSDCPVIAEFLSQFFCVYLEDFNILWQQKKEMKQKPNVCLMTFISLFT